MSKQTTFHLSHCSTRFKMSKDLLHQVKNNLYIKWSFKIFINVFEFDFRNFANWSININRRCSVKIKMQWKDDGLKLRIELLVIVHCTPLSSIHKLLIWYREDSCCIHDTSRLWINPIFYLYLFSFIDNPLIQTNWFRHTSHSNNVYWLKY